MDTAHAHHDHLRNESLEDVQAGYLEAHPVLQLLFAVILTLTAMVGIFGNILVILTVAMTKTLRIPSNMFIVNLAIADLVVTTVVDPFNVIGAFVGSAYFRENMALCQMIASLCAPACLCSMFSICAISVNRYIMICHYHRYESLFMWRKTGIICLCLWFLAYCLHFPNHVGWGSNDFDPTFYICTFSIATHSYAIFYISLGVFVPLVVVLFSYASIFRRYYHVKRDIRKHRATALKRLHKAASTGSFTTRSCDPDLGDQTSRLHVPLLLKFLNRSPSAMSISQSEQSSMGAATGTVASLAIVSPTTAASCPQLHCPKKSFTRDDIKLAKTLFTVFIAFLVCWSPFSLLVLMKQPDTVPGWIYMIAIIMAHGNSSINCILYGLTNEKFREGYKSVLGMEARIRVKRSETANSGSLIGSRTGRLAFSLPLKHGKGSDSVRLSNNRNTLTRWFPGSAYRQKDRIRVVGKLSNAKPKQGKKRPLSDVIDSSISDQLLSPNGIIIVCPDTGP